MIDSPSVSSAWIYRATIEILKPADAPTLIGDAARGFQFRPARFSPTGRQRFHLFVDMTMGERQSLEISRHMLRAMSRAAAAGRVRGFKIVHDVNTEQSIASTPATMLQRVAAA